MNFNRILVKAVKQQDPRFTSIPKEAGVYRWWFPKKLAIQLLHSIPEVDTDRICKKRINQEEYWCLYFGIAKDLRQRIRWHACQKHTASAVKHGILSTLRQSISALLKMDQTTSTDRVSEVLELCYWDWLPQESKKEALKIEESELSEGYYPINIQGNKSISPIVLSKLKELRKEYKK